MDVRSIPDRTINNPFLNIHEQNAILQQIRNPPLSSRYEQTSYGTALLDNKPYTGPINVQFVNAVAAYSIFAIKFVDRPFYGPYPTATADVVADYTTLKQTKSFIFCTNANNSVEAGTVMECQIVGFETPRLLRYTSTAPLLGDRLHITPPYVIKRSGGQLMACSEADTGNQRIWVIRHHKLPEVYGAAGEDITYGSSGTLNLWRGPTGLTDPLETEEVAFDFLGQPGQVIPTGAYIEAKWWDDLQLYRISNGNCIAF